MQPYFFPYIGYFQLINAVDKFVIYDNIQFTKKGWFHRNRLLVNGKEKIFTLPIKKDSDYLDVNKRILADNKDIIIGKTLRIIKQSYVKAPYFKEVYPLFEEIFNYNNNKNLFEYIYNSVLKLKDYLEIDTEIIISSKIPIKHELKGQDKVIEIVKELKGNIYINSIGGQNLYDKRIFAKNDIDLQFIESKPVIYNQFGDKFIPWLSIIDVMMFNSIEQIQKFLNEYNLN